MDENELRVRDPREDVYMCTGLQVRSRGFATYTQRQDSEKRRAVLATSEPLWQPPSQQEVRSECKTTWAHKFSARNR